MEGLNIVLISILASVVISAYTTKIITAKHVNVIDSYFKDGIKKIK